MAWKAIVWSAVVSCGHTLARVPTCMGLITWLFFAFAFDLTWSKAKKLPGNPFKKNFIFLQHRQEEEVYPLTFCCVQSSCWMLPKGLRVQQEEVYPLTFCCVHCTELLLYPLTFCCGRQASRQKCTNWKNGSIYSLFAQADTLIKSSNFFWTPCCS